MSDGWSTASSASLYDSCASPQIAVATPARLWAPRATSSERLASLEVEQVAIYDRTVQGALREVSDALAGRRFLAEQVATLERAMEAQERIARIARLRYREGVANYLEVLDAERNLFDAQQQLLAIRRAYLQNRGTLFVALGGRIVDAEAAPGNSVR